MIYLELFLTFLMIGTVSFGGGYGMIALIRETVLANGWLSDSEFLNFIAVSESTPGPLAVNMATFVGSSQGGLLGAAVATLGVVLPSFVIILVISAVLKSAMKYAGVNAFLSGVRPCVVAMILATALTMALNTLFQTCALPIFVSYHHAVRRLFAGRQKHFAVCFADRCGGGIPPPAAQKPFADRDDPAVGGTGYGDVWYIKEPARMRMHLGGSFYGYLFSHRSKWTALSLPLGTVKHRRDEAIPAVYSIIPSWTAIVFCRLADPEWQTFFPEDFRMLSYLLWVDYDSDPEHRKILRPCIPIGRVSACCPTAAKSPPNIP